jgi:hypothetical protein
MRESSIAICGTVMLDGSRTSKELSQMVDPALTRFIKSHSIGVCDFETVLSVKSGAHAKAVSLIVDPGYASILTEWGFTHANCIHNHCLDAGVEGFDETVENFTRVGIKPLTGGPSLFGRAHTVESVGGRRVALLSYSAIGEVGLRYDAAAVALHEIADYRHSCDYVIVFFHDGYDLAPIPLPSALARYRGMCDAGADIVFVNQAHVYQGYERLDSHWVFPSTGNFLVHTLGDRRWAPIDRGVVVSIGLEESLSLEISPTRIDTRTLVVALDPASGSAWDEFWNARDHWYRGLVSTRWAEFTAKGIVAGPFLAQQVFTGLPLWVRNYGMLGLLKILRIYANGFHRRMWLALFCHMIRLKSLYFFRFKRWP